MALEVVQLPSGMHRTAVRPTHVCAVVRESVWAVSERLERPRALVDQALVSRKRVRGGVTTSFESLRVDASAVGGFCCGVVSKRRSCRDPDATRCDAD